MTLLTILLSASAWAAEPRLHAEAHAVGALDQGDRWGVGGGVGLGVSLAPRVRLEAVGEVIGGDLGLAVRARPQLRGYLTPAESERGAASLVVGPEFPFLAELPARMHLGAALDLPRWGRLVPTIEAGVLAGPNDPFGARLSLGGRLGHRPGAPVPGAITPVDAPPLPVDPPGTMAWLPHPYCAWVPAEELGRWRGVQGPVRLSAPGYLPATTTANVEAVRLQPVSEQGWLVVVAWPGDRAWLGEEPIALSDDGIATFRLDPGAVGVTVEGGGRKETHEAVLTDGYGLWIRAGRPPVVDVRFAAGSSTVDAAARQAVKDVAAVAGAATFVVSGSTSPEGSEDFNKALADRRARAVAAALVEAGLPASRVRLGPAVAVDGTVEAQRAVRITPEVDEP